MDIIQNDYDDRRHKADSCFVETQLWPLYTGFTAKGYRDTDKIQDMIDRIK